MPQDPSKKQTPGALERGFGAPRIEKPAVAPEGLVEQVRANIVTEAAAVSSRGEQFKHSIQKRADTLSNQDEAQKIAAEAQAEIDKNNAELLAAQEAAVKELEQAWFSTGEAMGSDGPLPTEVVKDKTEEEVNTMVEPDVHLVPTERKSEDVEAKVEPREESVTKILPRKKEIPQEIKALKEKIDALTKEVDEQGARRAVYYGPDGFERSYLGQKNIDEAAQQYLGRLAESSLAASFKNVHDVYPDAKPFESLAYKFIKLDKNSQADTLQKIGLDVSDLHYLSLARTIQEGGQRANEVRIDAVISKALAIKINELFNTNPKAAHALFLKLLPKNIPIGQAEQLLLAPRYIGGELLKEEIAEPSKPQPRAAAVPSPSPSSAPVATPTPAAPLIPDLIIPPPPKKSRRAASSGANTPDTSAVPPNAPSASNVPAPATSIEQPAQVEQLLAERRMLQREWEQAAGKLTEQKMSKTEQKKYQQLLAETGEKNKKMKSAERQKLISDVGFTEADYQMMKAGTKPWTVNAIWKRLGELDREIATGRVASAPRAAHVASNVPRAARVSALPAMAPATAVPDRAPGEPDTDREKITNEILGRMATEHAADVERVKQAVSVNENTRDVILQQARQAQTLWQRADVRGIGIALVPDLASKEAVAKLSDKELNQLRDRFILNLTEVIQLVERPATSTEPAVNRPAASSEPTAPVMKPDAVQVAAAEAEVVRAIQFDDVWYKDDQAAVLKKWRAARSDEAIKKILAEKMYIDPDTIALLGHQELTDIQTKAIDYLVNLKAAEQSSETTPDAAKKVAPTSEINKQIAAQMKTVADLRKAVYRREKGAAAKLRTAGARLAELREKRRKLKAK